MKAVEWIRTGNGKISEGTEEEDMEWEISEESREEEDREWVISEESRQKECRKWVIL